MIAINNRYYAIAELNKLLENNHEDFLVWYKRGINDAYERIKYILFGAPCGCRPVNIEDVKLKIKYSKYKVLDLFMNLEEDDIEFILNCRFAD